MLLYLVTSNFCALGNFLYFSASSKHLLLVARLLCGMCSICLFSNNIALTEDYNFCPNITEEIILDYCIRYSHSKTMHVLKDTGIHFHYVF